MADDCCYSARRRVVATVKLRPRRARAGPWRSILKIREQTTDDDEDDGAVTDLTGNNQSG